MTTLLRNTLFCFLVACVGLTSSQVWAKKIGGIEIPDTMQVGQQELTLNGAGKRKRAIVSIYLASLYLPQASSDANAIVMADEPMALQLNIISGLLNNKKMKAALIEGFNKSTGGNTAPIQDGIDQLLQLMDDQIAKKDVYVLAYEPGVGTQVSKNGNLLGSVPGLELKQALFGIWLSDNPVQGKLKKALLGS